MCHVLKLVKNKKNKIFFGKYFFVCLSLSGTLAIQVAQGECVKLSYLHSKGKIKGGGEEGIHTYLY